MPEQTNNDAPGAGRPKHEAERAVREAVQRAAERR